MKGWNPTKWIWGLIPILFVAFIVIAGEGPKIEQDLTRRVAAALEKQGFSWAQVKFNGRDGILTGTAFSPEERTAALTMVKGVRGAASVQDKAELLPVVTPYMWWATRSGKSVKIKGHVPTQADRATILGIVKATMPELDIDDRMKLAAGTPEKQRWLGAISFALIQLGHLDNGSVRLSQMQLTVAGEAVSETSYGAVRNALQTQLPAGLALAEQSVVPPAIKPYSWAAHYKEGTLKLTGHVPSEEERRAILDSVREAFGITAIEDGMTLGSGNPDGWSQAVRVAIAQLSRLDEGEVTFKGEELAIEGVALDADTATDVAKTVRNSLPANFKSVEKVGARELPGQGERPKALLGGRQKTTMHRSPGNNNLTVPGRA